MKRLVWIVLPVLVVAAGCRDVTTRSRPAYTPPYARVQPPPPATTYGRTYVVPSAPSVARTDPRPAPPPSSAPAPATRPSVPRAMFSSGEFRWIPSLAQARDAARSQGKLIFLETGRDACGNCQALKNKVIPSPSIAGELGAIAVGYYDDCDRDPNSQAYRVLRDNLPNAVMLPLVGWVTPDMRWVHGFSGRRDEARFRQDIATARATYLRMAAVDDPAQPARELAQAPVRAVVAVPQSLPDEELADVASAVGEDATSAAAPGTLPLPDAPAPSASPAPEFAPAPPTPAPPAPAVAPTVSSPVPAPASAAPPMAGEAVRAWARESLLRAAEALRVRDFSGARAIVAEVRARAQGAPEEREADKADVAIHGLRRLDAATGAEATKIRAEAAAALRGTVWEPLFS